MYIILYNYYNLLYYSIKLFVFIKLMIFTYVNAVIHIIGAHSF